MSIVNMHFVVTLVNAGVRQLLELLESTTQEFHSIGEQHALANAHLSVALQRVAAGHDSDLVVASVTDMAVAVQRLQCLLDQHRENVTLVREVLRERVLSMSAGTPAAVEAYRAALLAEESGSND